MDRPPVRKWAEFIAVLSTKPVFALCTEELKFRIQEAKYMHWSSKGQSANSFARLIGLQTERFRPNYLPFEYFGLQKVRNKRFFLM